MKHNVGENASSTMSSSTHLLANTLVELVWCCNTLRCKLYNHQGTKEPKNRGKQWIIDGQKYKRETTKLKTHEGLHTNDPWSSYIQENESTIQINDKKTHLKDRQCVKQRKLGPWSKDYQ